MLFVLGLLALISGVSGPSPYNQVYRGELLFRSTFIILFYLFFVILDIEPKTLQFRKEFYCSALLPDII